MRKVSIISLIIFAGALCGLAFSPYENYLMSGAQRHVMLLASVRQGKESELNAEIKKLSKLKKKGISNISGYLTKLNKKQYVLIYFDYNKKEYLNAVADFEKLKQTQALGSLVDALPLAKSRGNTWLQLEWICYIQGAELHGKPSSRFSMVTRVKPEKEMEYRMLHQTVWPGIVDWMKRKGYHNFSIYVTYIDDQIYEFFYTETIKPDQKAATIKNMESETAYKRWLNNTDACQNPLKGADGIWLMTDSILK